MTRATLLLIALVVHSACGGCSDGENSPNSSPKDGGGSPDATTQDLDETSPDLGDVGDADVSTTVDLGDPGTPGEPWVNVTPTGRSPEPRRHPKMVFDEARDQAVLVNGGETWVWTGEIWEMVAAAPGPAERTRFALAYDAAREVVVLFGGWLPTDLTLHDDTWIWDGTSWSEVTTQTAPPATFGHTMVYDAAREQVVLYGGGGEAGLPRNDDTWAWDGSDWSVVDSAAGTGPTAAIAMAYDAGRETVVLYGGDASIWEFAGSDWQLVDQGATAPAGRSAPGMIYDPVRGRVLFFGGQNSGIYFTDTWTWDGDSWSDITAEVGALPRGRTEHAAAYDGAHGGALFYGGYGNTGDTRSQQFNETYVVRDGRWTEVSPDASPGPRDGVSMAYDTKREVMFLYGGFANELGVYPQDSWTWDGEFWRRVAHTSLPSRRFGAAMAYDAVRDEMVMFGGGDTTNTFVWNGAEWEARSPVDVPSGVQTQVLRMVWDAAREEILLYANRSTWTWDGANWTLVAEEMPFDQFNFSALVYDPVRQAVVMFGSRYLNGESTATTTAWSWDGALWTELETTATRPAGRNFAGAFWDTRRESFVLFGGADPRANPFGDTWELDDNVWRDITPEVSPQPRYRFGMAFDVARQRGVVFGGEGTEGSTWEWIGSAAVPVD